MKKFPALTIAILLICFAHLCADAQTVRVINTETKASFRGLSVVNDQTLWVSGTGGTVGRSIDGGTSWKWITVKDFEKTDFRDIEAFDDKTAIIMGIASPAYILKTTDAGDNWKIVYENKDSSMFLDAMEFWNEQSGIVIGDPIQHRFFIARTFDGGDHWQMIPENYRPLADSGEACFASSGTNIRKLNKKEAVFITGGLSSHMHIRNERFLVPILQGKESTGANSVGVKNNHTLIIVGGDFTTKDASLNNCVITTNGGKSFTTPQTAPHGYRSCVEWLGKTNWVSCGLNGVDFSTDEGNTWKWIGKDGYHVCRKAKKGKAVYFAGGGGRIGKMEAE